MKKPLSCATLAAAFLLTGCGGDPEESVATSSSSSPLVGGRPTAAHPAVGMVVADFTEGGVGYREKCTGTLIAPNKVLTATHCLNYGQGTTAVSFVLAKGAYTTVASNWTFNNAVTKANYSRTYSADFAVLTVDAVPPNIATPVRIASSLPGAGESVTIVGFGCPRREACTAEQAKQAITFKYGPSQVSAPGDSGGPTFRADGSLFRITSGYSNVGGGDWFADAVKYRATILKW